MDKPEKNDNTELDFDPRHVETFLRKIHSDRDAEIEEISARAASEIAKIRKAAFSSNRALAHRTIKAAREQEARERDRYLYKVKSELKRQHWQILAELRQQVLAKARATFEAAWNDPLQQWAWCKSWIDTAAELAQDQPLHIQLGMGGNKQVVAKARRKLKDYPGEYSIAIDKAAPAGIIIGWPDHYLDGTLISHCQEVSSTVIDRLAHTLTVATEEAS